MNTTHPQHLAPQGKSLRWLAARLAICVGLLTAASLHAVEPLSSAQEQAQRILQETGVTGGLVVHVGCGDGKLTAAMIFRDRTNQPILRITRIPTNAPFSSRLRNPPTGYHCLLSGRIRADNFNDT